ncbi:MAG: hypothetical protein ACJ8F1_04945 [Polyangia bacterium]
MLRITPQATAGGALVLTIEGRLVGPWIAELRRVVGATPARPVQVQLGGLEFADTEGAALLRELRKTGVELLDASGFVAALIGGDDGGDGHSG